METIISGPQRMNDANDCDGRVTQTRREAEQLANGWTNSEYLNRKLADSIEQALHKRDEEIAALREVADHYETEIHDIKECGDCAVCEEHE